MPSIVQAQTVARNLKTWLWLDTIRLKRSQSSKAWPSDTHQSGEAPAGVEFLEIYKVRYSAKFDLAERDTLLLSLVGFGALFTRCLPDRLRELIEAMVRDEEHSLSYLEEVLVEMDVFIDHRPQITARSASELVSKRDAS